MKPSEIKKLAKVCREAGIKHFKNADFEFTLTDDMPAYVRSIKPGKMTQKELDAPIQSDDISEEAMLFWSSGEDFSEDTKVS